MKINMTFCTISNNMNDNFLINKHNQIFSPICNKRWKRIQVRRQRQMKWLNYLKRISNYWFFLYGIKKICNSINRNKFVPASDRFFSINCSIIVNSYKLFIVHYWMIFFDSKWILVIRICISCRLSDTTWISNFIIILWFFNIISICTFIIHICTNLNNASSFLFSFIFSFTNYPTNKLIVWLNHIIFFFSSKFSDIKLFLFFSFNMTMIISFYISDGSSSKR